LILAAIGCVDVIRERARPKADLVTGMVLWVVVGAIAFLIQGWADFKWSLFTVPVGILDVTGVEALVRVTASPGKGRACCRRSWPQPPR
jgi:hypothetical protein